MKSALKWLRSRTRVQTIIFFTGNPLLFLILKNRVLSRTRVQTVASYKSAIVDVSSEHGWARLVDISKFVIRLMKY